MEFLEEVNSKYEKSESEFFEKIKEVNKVINET
jgi:hypothetical protein